MLTDEEILSIGLGLEAKGMSHSEIDAYFEHHGVKGQKWGIRQSKSTTGVSRPRGALIDSNNARIRNIKSLQSGEFHRRAALGRALYGKETYKTLLSTNMKLLNEQNSRLKSGKINVHDRLRLVGHTTIANAVATKNPQFQKK